MISKDLVAASSKPFILSILSQKKSYGYEIIKKVHELSGSKIQWKDGMLYPVLHKLENEKLIESFWISRHRLGDTEALSTEYAKVNRADIWKKRILWFISGYFLIVSFSTITNLCFYQLHFVNIPWTIKTSFSKLGVTFPILFYILIFIIIAGILFFLTSRKNIKGKNIVNRLCSPIEKKKYEAA